MKNQPPHSSGVDADLACCHWSDRPQPIWRGASAKRSASGISGNLRGGLRFCRHIDALASARQLAQVA
jgi:hypothetical protein